MVMHSAHNERKQETIVKNLLENWGTSKKITLSLHSLHSLHGLHSLQSAWSAFQHDRSLRDCWRVNKQGDPIFLLHFFSVHIMNVDYAKFQKSLIVEQFQGNYLKGLRIWVEK